MLQIKSIAKANIPAYIASACIRSLALCFPIRTNCGKYTDSSNQDTNIIHLESVDMAAYAHEMSVGKRSLATNMSTFAKVVSKIHNIL